jgi:hypothetical protein
MGGRRVETDFPPTMGGGQVIEKDVDGLGVLHVPAPPSREQRERAEAERHRAIESAERQRILERLTFARNQPLRPVALADIVNIKLNLAMTLSGAGQILEDAGGAVRPGDAGTLRFELPERLHPDPLTHEAAWRAALEAVICLDAARAVVHHCLTKRKPLPDLRPAAGGGVA